MTSAAIFAKHIEAARKAYAAPSDNDIEIDDDPNISEAEGGLWVAAWVWVRDEDVPGAEEEGEQ